MVSGPTVLSPRPSSYSAADASSYRDVQVGRNNRKGALHVVDHVAPAGVDVANQNPPVRVAAGVDGFLVANERSIKTMKFACDSPPLSLFVQAVSVVNRWSAAQTYPL